MPYLMKCGHASNATSEGKPACAICGCIDIIKECKGIEGLEGRKAKCSQCGKSIVNSKWELPFFKHRPDREYDTYYCGCWGWD